MSSQLLNGPFELRFVLTPRVGSARERAVAVIGGRRPLLGSITIEVRRDGVPRSSQCGGGDVAEPTAPALAVSAVSTSKSSLAAWSWRSACTRRSANSSSVSSWRVPNRSARSKGTPSSGSLVQVPWMSGSPQGVRAVAVSTTAAASTAAAAHAIQTPKYLRICSSSNRLHGGDAIEVYDTGPSRKRQISARSGGAANALVEESAALPTRVMKCTAGESAATLSHHPWRLAATPPDSR